MFKLLMIQQLLHSPEGATGAGASSEEAPLEPLTAKDVAKILKEAMPTIVEEAGQKVAEQIKDGWEESLETRAKEDEQKKIEKAKSHNMPFDVQKAVSDAKKAVVREGQAKSKAWEAMASIFSAMAKNKSDDPYLISRTIKDSSQDTEIIDIVEKAVARQEVQRDTMQASQFDNAGILIPEQISNEIIPLLESLTFVRRRAGSITLERGTMKLHKQNQRAQAFYGDELDDYTQSAAKFSDLKLDAKKLMAMSIHSREMAMFGGSQAAQIITNDLITALAQRSNNAFLRGAGTEKTPRGIRNWIRDENIFNDPVTDFQNNIQNLLATVVRSIVTLLNTDLPVTTANTQWAINPDIWAQFYRAHDPGSGISPFRSEVDSGRILGYEFDVSTSVPKGIVPEGGEASNEMYLIHYPAVLIGAVNGIRLEQSSEASYVDEEGKMRSMWSRDEVGFKAAEYHDMVLRYDFGAVVQYLPEDWTGEPSSP